MEGKASNKKLSLREFIWLGFNYTVGIGFVGNFAVLSNIGQINSIGINAIWVYLVIGFIAGNCAWAFAKMAKIHNSDANGAAYIYVRTSFGRFLGWIVGFMQYVMLPFIITIQIMMLIKGTFSPEFAGKGWYNLHWGNFGDFYLDLIGIVIYLAAASVIFFGIKIYKKLAHGTGIIKWVTAFALIIAAFALAIQNGSSNWEHWTSNSKLTFTGFMNAFTSCFFFFAGFEVFATAGKNIQNPEKNIGKGITLIILISTIFYVVVSIIFFLAFSEFLQNMNMGVWDKFDNNKIIVYGGPIIMIISGLALKINVAMQNALYGGTVLQPLSEEGYISDRLFKLNNDGIPVKAAILNLGITSVMIVLWLVIPDLIKGFWLNAHPNQEYQSAFNISSLTAASSFITIFIYMMVLTVVLKLTLTKKIKLNLYEKIIFPIVFVFLALTLFWHYYSLITDTVNAMKQPDATTAPIVAVVIEVVFILGSFIFAVCWYRWYYMPKYEKRLKENPELQKQLDATFDFNQDYKEQLASSNLETNKKGLSN